MPDSMVHEHHVYKSVLGKEPANPHDKFTMAVIKRFSDSGPHFKRIFTDHVVFYYTKGLCYLLYYWEKEERKRLRSSYHVNIFIIIDPQKTRHLICYNAVSPGHLMRPGVYTRPAII